MNEVKAFDGYHRIFNLAALVLTVVKTATVQIREGAFDFNGNVPLNRLVIAEYTSSECNHLST